VNSQIGKALCKLFGHRWRDTSSYQTIRTNGQYVDCWQIERQCDRCELTETGKATPLSEMQIIKIHSPMKLVDKPKESLEDVQNETR